MHFAPFRFACEQLQREQSLSAPIRFRKQGFLQIELVNYQFYQSFYVQTNQYFLKDCNAIMNGVFHMWMFFFNLQKEGYLNTEVGYFSVLLKVGLLEDDTVGKDLWRTSTMLKLQKFLRTRHW